MQMGTAPTDVYKYHDYAEYHRASYLLEDVELVDTGLAGYREEKQKAIKRLIAKYGAVCIDFKVPNGAPVYNNTNNPLPIKGDHAVVLVG